MSNDDNTSVLIVLGWFIGTVAGTGLSLLFNLIIAAIGGWL